MAQIFRSDASPICVPGRTKKLFKTALGSDLKDPQGGTTPEGIRIGAMAGTADLVQRCYTGLDSVSRPIAASGTHLGHLKLTALRCPERPIKIGFQGTLHHFHEGETKAFSLSP